MTKNNADLFLLAYRSCSIHEAASNSNISRSSISKAISQIEKEYNTVLFERTQNGIYPTEAAKRLHDTICRTNDMFDELKTSLSEQHATNIKLLRIGVMASSCQHVVKILTETFSQSHQEYCLYIQQIRPDSYHHKLISGELDAVISCVASNEQTPEYQDRIPICRVKPTLILQNNHPAIEGEDLKWNSLSEYPFITLSDTPNFLSSGFLYYLNEQSLPRHTSILVNDMNTIMDQVYHNNAIGILPDISVLGWPDHFSRPITVGSVNIDLMLLTCKDTAFRDTWKDDLHQCLLAGLDQYK